MTKVSIIVPAYNAASTLLQTLDSLLNQTYRDYEVVLVDDGSTDATRRLAEAYCANPRMRVVRQSNRGAAAARNTGIAAARGRYIGFCDADDMWHPQKLATHVEHLDANPDIGVSFSATTLVDEEDRPLGQFQRPKLHNISAAHLFKRNPVGTVSTVVARREALEEVSYRPYHENDRDWVFDEQLQAFDDFECWLRMALTTLWKIEGVNGLLTRQRVNITALRHGIDRQIAGWDQMIAALRPAAPAFFLQHEPAARAHQLHFLTRSRALDPEADRAGDMMHQALALSLRSDMHQDPAPDFHGEMARQMTREMAGNGAGETEQEDTPSSFASMVLGAISGGAIARTARSAPSSWI